MWPMVMLKILYLSFIGGGASEGSWGEPLLHYLVLFKWNCHLTPKKHMISQNVFKKKEI